MMACQVTETLNSIEFVYCNSDGAWPSIVTAAGHNVINGYVYVGAFGAPLGRDECLRLAEWLIRQAREMREKP